jgi:hypothetical protein
VRAGAGLLYTLSRATVFGHTGSGFNVNSAMTWTRDGGATRYATLSNPYPDGMLLPPGRSLGDRTFLGLGAGTIVRGNRNPEYYSWNLSVQRELRSNFLIEANYTGSRGVHLYAPDTSLAYLDPRYWGMGRTELNRAVANPFFGIVTDPRSQLSRETVQQFRLLRPMQHFDGPGRSEPNRSDSVYHAAQVKLEKRFSSGTTMLAHYTFSKLLDNASVTSGNLTWLGGTTSMQNPLDYSMERALSVHDVPHRFVVTGAFELPFGRGRAFGASANRWMDAVIGGWEITGFFSLQSGTPLQVTQSGGTLWNGTQRPHLNGDPSTSGPMTDRLNQYFNETAFARPDPDTFGSAPRYLGYRGPRLNTMDVALLKSWRIRDDQRVEFRLEAANALNHPVFSEPNTSYGSSSFGQITGTKVGPRNVQLGFKYHF